MVYLQTKNTDLGKYRRVLQWNEFVIFIVHLVYFTAIYGHLVYFSVLVYCIKKNLATLLSPARIKNESKKATPSTSSPHFFPRRKLYFLCEKWRQFKESFYFHEQRGY
jgi:hypothetical protein